VTAWSFPRADSLPTYAFVATDAVKARAVAHGKQLIDLGLGNPDRPTPAAIVAQLHAAVDVGKNHRYHPGRGLPALRTAIAAWYERRYRVRFDVEREALVTMGAKEGISHLCFAILDRGDTAVVPDPCYPIHQGAPFIAGAEVVGYPVKSGLEPAKAVADAIQRVERGGQKTKLVIANYPHNPTGMTVGKSELADLVRVVERSGALLLHDVAYADLDFGARHAPSIFDCGIDPEAVKKFAVEVFSMSKSYNMPGWRIAYMVGNERMIGALAHLKTYLDYGTFMPLQYAAAWALEHGDQLVDEIRSLYESRATALVAGLRAAGWGEVGNPSGTMFLWTRLPQKVAAQSSVDAVTWLIEHAEVALSPGTGFGPGGEGFVRFALIEDPERIAEACKRIGNALAR
jgi:alanine-synthesizing transaminase